MAVDGGIKIIRQYSDEGKNLASRVRLKSQFHSYHSNFFIIILGNK